MTRLVSSLLGLGVAAAVLLLGAPSFTGPATAAAAEDGATLFATYCVACHGATGKGDGAASAALEPKPADFTNPEFWKGRDDAHITKVIKEGGASVGKSPLMTPWGAVLSDEQVAALVKHLHTFGKVAE